MGVFFEGRQEIIIQISKEPISTKGPRVTRHITLPGRHVVYMPYIEHTGVSRRIESDEERERLKGVLDELRDEGVGVIARTAAEGQGQKTLKADYGILVKLWKELSKSFKKIKAPNLCYQDLPFVHRVLRDITDENVENY